MSNQKIQDVYWREYTYEMPIDALFIDSFNPNKIYIGQAYVQDHGLSIIPIDPNDQFRAIVTGLPVVEKHFTKILCGDQNSMRWISTTSTDFHKTMFKSKMVIGGFEENCFLGIGKIYDTDYHVGKIMGKSYQNVLMYYIDITTDKSTNENLYSLKSTSKFQVLVY